MVFGHVAAGLVAKKAAPQGVAGRSADSRRSSRHPVGHLRPCGDRTPSALRFTLVVRPLDGGGLVTGRTLTPCWTWCSNRTRQAVMA